MSVNKMENKTFVYVSSWDKASDGSGNFGLSAYAFQPETGEIQLVETVEPNVLFNVTCIDQKRGILYALNEENELPGLRAGGGGRIFAFRIDPDTGKLTRLCVKETWCPSPSYLSFDQSGKFLIVSNHGSKAAVTKIEQDAYGNYFPVIVHDDAVVELFSVKENGEIDRLLDVVKHTGSGPEKRQLTAHPHSVVMSPSGKFFAVCDKGNDTIRMYGLDTERGKLILPHHVHQCPPGSLPRYCVFHPQKPWLFHNNENNGTFCTLHYEEDGSLTQIASCSVLPEPLEMQERILEQQGLVIDQNGQYIYDVTRGPNIVTVLQVDQQTGCTSPIQYQEIPGKWPRGCTISPDGRFLLICCLDSGEIVEYSIGPDGCLSETGNRYPHKHAAFTLFYEV